MTSPVLYWSYSKISQSNYVYINLMNTYIVLIGWFYFTTTTIPMNRNGLKDLSNVSTRDRIYRIYRNNVSILIGYITPDRIYQAFEEIRMQYFLFTYDEILF